MIATGNLKPHKLEGGTMTRRYGILGPAVGVVILVGTGSAALADCAELRREVDAAFDRLAGVEWSDIVAAFGKMEELEAKINAEPTCPSGELLDLQLRRATLELQLAEQARTKGIAPSVSEALIVDADKPQALWQAARALGDIDLKARRFADAQRAYERAIEILNNPDSTIDDPSEDEKKALHAAAAQAKGLANSSKGQFVESRSNARDGKLGGVYVENLRGFRPPAVPLPIQFDTDAATLTDDGARIALELLTALQQQRPKEVLIVGHTDPRGSDEHNLKLSADRAMAVAAFLKKNGYEGAVTTGAKGEGEPVFIRDSSLYTQEDIWALDRRVEWVRREASRQ